MKIMNNWYVLNSNGLLECVGECIDYEQADHKAAKKGLEVVWIIDPDTARQHAKVLLEE